jgi:hypothetical protein
MTLTTHQQEIVTRILALRKMTADLVSRRRGQQNDLLDRLNADDLAAVAAALYKPSSPNGSK